jgi:glutathione S-transferase
MIRLALHDIGIEYEDAFPTPDWPTAKKELSAKGLLTFGQLPLYEDGTGKSFVQSQAILRHLARAHGRYGATEEEQTRVDTALDGVGDWRRVYSKLVYQDNLAADALAVYKTSLLGTAGEGWAALFERFIAANPAGPTYLAAATCTVADIALWDLVDTNLRIIPELLDTFPTLKAWYTTIGSRPGIKAYVASNPAHREKANGNGLG